MEPLMVWFNGVIPRHSFHYVDGSQEWGANIFRAQEGGDKCGGEVLYTSVEGTRRALFISSSIVLLPSYRIWTLVGNMCGIRKL